MVFNKKIGFNEVLRRWAIGEVGSKEFGIPNFEEERKKLKLNDFTQEDLERCLNRRWPYYIPTINQLNADWIIKPFKLIIKELPKFYTINDSGWKQKTNGTYKLANAVFNYINYPDENSREFKITRNFKNLDIDDFTGITLIYEKLTKKYIIAEGHSRLIALYNHLIINKKRISLPLEFAIGYTNNKWYFSPF